MPTNMKTDHTTIFNKGGWMAATTMKANRENLSVDPTWFIRSRKRDPVGRGIVRTGEGISTGSLTGRPNAWP